MTVKLAGSRRLAGIAAIGAVAMTLAACGGGDDESTSTDDNEGSSEPEETSSEDTSSEETSSESGSEDAPAESDSDAPAAGGSDLGLDYASLSGEINGSGASSQANAMQAWRDNFATEAPDLTVNYTQTGSGTGREQFVGGEVSFIGTDSLFEGDELAAAEERCGGPIAELPTYVSPIAVAFNLPGVDSLNLTPETISYIFDGTITTWDDPDIADANPDVELPALPIIPVNRSDDSGTTENFAQWLVDAGTGWEHEVSDVWPITGTQSAEGTSGVVQLVEGTEGAITYADASQINDLGTAAVGLADGSFVEYSAEAAAAIVDGSPAHETATDTILSVDLLRDGSIADAYPVVLISYHVACLTYEDEAEAANVQGFLAYIASAEGQEAASSFGVAPISDQLRETVNGVISQISAG